MVIGGTVDSFAEMIEFKTNYSTKFTVLARPGTSECYSAWYYRFWAIFNCHIHAVFITFHGFSAHLGPPCPQSWYCTEPHYVNVTTQEKVPPQAVFLGLGSMPNTSVLRDGFVETPFAIKMIKEMQRCPQYTLCVCLNTGLYLQNAFNTLWELFFLSGGKSITITGNFGNPDDLPFFLFSDKQQAFRTYTTTKNPAGMFTIFQTFFSF